MLVNIGKFLGGMALLVGTWYFLFPWIAFIHAGVFVPWDSWADMRPPTGTWERSTNDFFDVFFDSPFGSMLPLVLLIVVNIAMLALGLYRSRDKAVVPAFLSYFNFLHYILVFSAVFIGRQLPLLWLSLPRPEIDLGYHRSWPSIVLTIAATALILLFQHKFLTEKI